MYSAINSTSKQQNIGGKLVYPGESRLIEDDQVNEALKKGFDVPGYVAAEKEETQEAPIPIQALPTEVLIDMTVKELQKVLNELTDEQILALETAEKGSDDPRETLLSAIVKEISERSQA